MEPKFNQIIRNVAQLRPGLGPLRLAALLAEEDSQPDDDTLDAMFEHVGSGGVETTALAKAAPADVWAELSRCLMARFPATAIGALRACGALAIVLPEVDALFGVPQIASDPAEVDIGVVLLNALAEAARRDAPLAVRFALLAMNVGKSDSPREHLPVHYRHVERAGPRIEAICDRFGAPALCRDLALLASAECERVHRVSDVRAGPIALMLERLRAFDDPVRFGLLLTICECDYRGHGGRSERDYRKSDVLRAAFAACASLGPVDDLDAAQTERARTELAQTARALAIARALGSHRWSGDAP